MPPKRKAATRGESASPRGRHRRVLRAPSRFGRDDSTTGGAPECDVEVGRGDRPDAEREAAQGSSGGGDRPATVELRPGPEAIGDRAATIAVQLEELRGAIVALHSDGGPRLDALQAQLDELKAALAHLQGASTSAADAAHARPGVAGPC